MLPTSRAFLVVVLAATLSGCAARAAMRAGQQAEFADDYDRAIVEYTRVLRERPDDREARYALDRVRLRAAQEHLTRGRRHEAAGRLDQALIELQLAGELNPGSADIDDALRAVRLQLRNRVAVAREGKTSLEALIERARTLPAEGDELPSGVRMPDSLTFRDAGARAVYTTIGRFADINIVFDPELRDQLVSLDLRNTTLEQALAAVSAASRTFYRVSGQRTVTVIPDTPGKRREYEQEVLKTFYLSNADLKETIDLLRVVVDARRIASITGTNALTIKDTPDRIAAAGRVIAAIDKARPEVVIDVELLEVDRTRLKEYGLQIASPGSPGVSGQIDANREGLTLRDLRNLTQSDMFLTGLPGLFYRLLKQDNNTRTLANPQLRTSEGMPAQARFGERVPIPVTTFAPIATGGVAQQPITTFQYENIGVNIDITPRTHHDDAVSLALKVEVSSLAGVGFGGLPTIANRSISTVIRLRDGETNLLAGLIRDDERRVLRGVPGLSDLPLVGSMFAHTRSETQETDVVLTLTPHIIRVLDLSEEDLRAFRVGPADAAPAFTIELPTPPQLPQPPRDPAAPVQQPAPAPNPLAPQVPTIGPAGGIVSPQVQPPPSPQTAP